MPRTDGTCIIVVTDPGGGGSGGGSGSGGGGGGGEPQPCEFAGIVIDCVGEQGTWDGRRRCYINPSPGEYANDDPIWAGHYPDGSIYLCYNPWIIGNAGYDSWAAGPPRAEEPSRTRVTSPCRRSRR